DEGSAYAQVIRLELDQLEPLVACPHSPDAVRTVGELGLIRVDQVVIGSCTNSSYTDLMRVAGILRGKRIHPEVSLVLAPGSRQVLRMLADNGSLGDLISAGARILECACGPCVGVGQAPPSQGVSVRTVNRNFEGRSGTRDALVYLSSPEVAAATALYGKLTDPRILGEPITVTLPDRFVIDDSMVLPPAGEEEKVEIIRGPNIKPLPINTLLPDQIQGSVVLITGDNITTDHIMPAGSKILPLRSNIPAIAEYVFSGIDPTFAARAKAAGQSFVVGGENYGQGSSREHAALAPMYLGIKGILVKSFARIHRANLINFGILPLTFVNPEDYHSIQQDDLLAIDSLREQILHSDTLLITNITKGVNIQVRHDLTLRQKEIILAGGLLNYVREGQQ
ncbi:MAG TPA: aconitate hydratase, partial [Clostridia bacterium]|nr:aconitate hydratase [Clostridia bacterium]